MMELVEARIFHERVRPRRNRFGYGALYCIMPLEDLSQPRSGLFAINRPGLFSIRAADYGDGGPAAHYIRRILHDFDLGQADGDIRLMSLPRVLGYGFNPVSFWLCQDRAGGLRAVLVEVNNTFGERHSYLCCHADHAPITGSDVLVSRKVFHVSPFIAVEGHYCFRFQLSGERVAINIDLEDADGLLLRTSVGGRRAALSPGRLLRALLANPLYPLKVIGLIHYQAVKIYLKGIRHFHKPPPPAAEVSSG